MRILFLLLFPVFLSAQINNAYGVIEIGSFPTSSSTGPKFAYRPADSSFYRWVSGSTWVKIIPDEPDTLYLKQLSGTTALVDGDTIDISTYFLKSDTTSAFASYLKRPVGWGLSLLTGKYPFVDSSKVASRYYVGTNPTTIANNYIATSNGSNLVARNLFDDNTAVEIKNGKPLKLGQWTTAGRPTGVTGYEGYNTTGNGKEWYQGSRWAYALESTFARGTATRIPFFDANGQITDNAGLTRNATTGAIIQSGTAEILFTGTNTTSSTSVALVAGSGSAATSGNVALFRNGAPVFTTNGSTIVFGPNNWQAGGLTGITFQGGFGGTTLGTSVIFSTNTPNTGPYTATSGTQTNVRIGGSNNTWQPSSGIATWNQLFINPVINSSGTYVGTVRGVYYQPTLSSLTGTTHRAWESTGGDMIVNSGSFGLGNSSPQRLLHVTGEARITDLTTDTPTRIVGADADGDLGAITVSTGLDLTSGVLTATGASTWLKTELEASRDVNIAGTSSSDFRIQNTRIQFDGKTKIGSDSSFVHDPTQDTTIINGTTVFGKQSSLGRQGVSGYSFVFRNPASASSSILIESGRTSPTDGGAGLQFLASGQFGGSIVFGTTTSSDLTFYSNFAGRGLFNIGLSNLVTGNKNTILVGSIQDPIQWDYNGRLVIYDTITSGKALFLAKKATSSSTPLAMFSSAANDRFTFNDDGTTRFHTYGAGNREAGDMSKTESSYAAWLMTDGTVGEKSLSTIRDGNGIYTGSGILANHTTRSLIPSTGNLLFSQTYNTTDSAYIQVINNLDGNREVRGGLTDTASTGFSKFRFYQDEPNEEMGWEILTSDGSGTTTVGGQGGNLSLYADAAGTVEVRGQELRLNNGEVSMNQYGQGNMKASDLSATDSKFVAKFGDAGKVLDYYLARDTFIEDVTLFSVGTLMNDCQELTVVSSMTSTAPTHQEIRFPDAGDHLRGKKIIVYQKKKEAGIYVPQIKVVGGVSRLYFTTTPGIGGTDPSDQSTLSIDDSTWSSHGTTFEFTCLRIDNTPSYRWVLKQR